MRLYGRHVVTREHDVVSEADPGERVSVLWPDDPRRTARVTYDRGHADRVIIWGKQSQWTGPYGITLGTPLTRLEELNRGPFDISGFQWDYGGYCSWKGGALEKALHGLQVVLGQNVDDPRLMGEREVSSGLAELHRINPQVEELWLSLK
ncbi:MAG: hypothetical protein ACYCW6_03425 [Candidatus Xenobia bacterium]